MKYKVIWWNGANVREFPTTRSKVFRELRKNQTVEITNIVTDLDDPTNPNKKWGETGDGWVAIEYPTLGLIPQTRLVEVVDAPEPEYQLYRVKRDSETDRWGGKMRDVLKKVTGTPAVMPFSTSPSQAVNTTYAKFSSRWQWFWVDLLAMSKYGKRYAQCTKAQKAYIAKAFKGMTNSKAFAHNYKGTDKFRNYITGENAKKPDSMQESLLCGNDIVAGTGRFGESKKYGKMVELVCFREWEYPPEVTPDIFGDPRVLLATVIKRNGWIYNFPQLGGKPCYYPFLSRGEAWYPLKWLEAL